MTYYLRPIHTLRKVKGDRLVGYDERADVYVVMLWTGQKWITIPGQFDFRPTHWYSLPAPRQK